MTQISLMRKDGQGIKGSIRNARHHAKPILPFIRILIPEVQKLGFQQWRQGHNIHEFFHVKDRKLTLRPFVRDGVYVGIRLALRVSKSEEFHLMDIESLGDIPILLNTMKKFAEGLKGDVGRSLVCNDM